MKDQQYCNQCGGMLDPFGRELPPAQPDGYLINYLESAAIAVKDDTIMLIKKPDQKLYLPTVLVRNKEDPIDAALRGVTENGGKATDAISYDVIGDPKRKPLGCYICCVYLMKGIDGPFIAKDYVKGHMDSIATEHIPILKKYMGL